MEEKDTEYSVGWGFVLLLLMLSIVLTSILTIFGGSWGWPALFFVGLWVTAVYRTHVHKERKKTNG